MTWLVNAALAAKMRLDRSPSGNPILPGQKRPDFLTRH